MECNCNNNSNGGVIPWVRGNRLPLCICIYQMNVEQETVGTMTHNSMTRTPYEIQEGDTVTVTMKSGFRSVEMPFTTDGNKVLVIDNGELPTGTYTVEVTIERGSGERGRWQESRQVRIYENTDEAILGEMYSIEADLFFWAKGDTGNGIANITSNPDNTLTITMTDGTTYTTQAMKGDKGDQGDQGEKGTSIVSFDVTGQTETSVIYTVTFSDDTTEEIAVPKGPQGDTGLTGNGISSTTLNSDYTLTIAYTDGTTYTTPSIRGAQGVQGVSIIAFTQTGETATNTLYNVVFSDGRTQSVAIPKGLKGDKGDTGNTGSQGVQGPKGDTVTATDYTLYNVQGSSSEGAMSQDATTKAISAQTGYYTCGAAADKADKVAAVENGNLYKRTLGGHFKVKMTNANTASGVTLQVGSETATTLWYNGAAVSATNTWDAGEVLSVYYDGTYYQASNAQGGSNKKINAYLYDDATPLSVGQVYNIGDSVKTADKQLRVITKDIKAFSLSEELKEGDIKKRSGATYRAASAVSTFNPSTEYAEGSYALGSMTVYTLSVTAESVVAGNITVNGTEVAIEETDDATAIAAKISSALNIDGWTDSASENIVNVRCNTIGNNTTTITISDTDNTGVVVDGISTPSETGTSVIRKYDGETWSNATADVMIEDEILVSVDEAWLIENATQQNSITQELTLHDTNVFKWANASCGSSNTSRIQVSVSNNKYKATGIGSTDATDTNRTAYFKFFSTSPLEEGKVYRISFDYSYKFTKRVSVGFGSSNTSIAHNLFTVSSSQERAGLHYEADIAYNSTYNNIVSTYVRSAVGDYLEITNVSIAERKTVKDTLLESMERIDEHETRLTTIEHTKAVELFDFDSAELKNQVGDAGDVTTALKDTVDNILKFTVVIGSPTLIRRAYIVLPDGLTDGQTYKVYFNHTNVSRTRTDIKIGTTSNYVSVKSVYNTAGTVNYTYTHFSGSKYLMFEFYHPDANDYIYISNLSIRLFGDVQNVADDFNKYIGINKKSIAELEEKLIENGAISIPPNSNFQWYSYSGAKILQPNRVGIETIIAYNSTGSTDYSGYPQGFSIWGDYAIGYNAGMPRLIVFNIKERRKVGQFASGVLGTVLARHCNSVDFTNAYYEEGDEFPLLYVSGNENRDGTNLSGVDYLMRISRNGDIFTSTLIQTITVRNENADGTVYHNTAVDRQTGKLWLRRGSSSSGGDGKADLFAVDLPAFKDSEGTRIPTADILIDLDSPTSTIDNYSSPQGGCVRNGIGYFAYGTQSEPAIVQAVDLVTGSQINAVNLRNIGYTLEIEDLAFWGGHMITSGGGTSAIYELHWE